MLKLIPEWVPIAAGAILALVFGVTVGAIAGTWHGKALGKEEARAEAAAEAVNRVNEMETRNANFKNMPARERCRLIMRDSGLPIEACDQRQRISDHTVQ